MDGAFFYILALLAALIPFSAILGSRLLYARANHSVMGAVRIKRLYALRQLGATTLLIVDMDCVRSNHAAHVLAVARRAGIKVCLATRGAARTTAAVRIGYAESAKAITVLQGKELRELTGQQLTVLLREKTILLSHLTSEDKVHLVTHAQQEGELVTLATADGADILPLEYATVGVAMGNTISEQTERVSDVIVADGDITTLAGAIQAGRVAIANSRKALAIALVSNVAAASIVMISLTGDALSHIPPAISVLQVVAITILAGTLPALLLAGDKHEGNPMHHSPRGLATRGVSRIEGMRIIWSGVVIGGLAYCNYLWFFDRNNLDAGYLTAGSTVHNSGVAIALITTALCLLVYTAHQRSAHGLFTKYQRHNKIFWAGIALAVVVIALLPLVPVPASVGLVLVSGVDWLYIMGSAIAFLGICEFHRHNRKHHRKAVLELHQNVHAKSLR